jgi:hypothetical protein
MKERPSRNSHLHVQFKTAVRQLLVCILFNPHPQRICTNLPLKTICAKAIVLLGWECNNNSKALQISTSSTPWGVSNQGEAMKAKLPLVLFSLLQVCCLFSLHSHCPGIWILFPHACLLGHLALPLLMLLGLLMCLQHL